MKNIIAAIGFCICLFFISCNNQSKPAEEKNKIVLRFELDSTGNIINADVRKQLIELAADITKNADRVILTSYTEQTGSEEKNINLANSMAIAAKDVMFKSNNERIYYSVGIDARGFENPVNEKNPADLINRRIEISYLTR